MSSSRRAFLRTLGAGGLVVAGTGGAPGGYPARAAQGAARAAGPIRLGSNENSHGPGPAALSAVQRSLAEANRYPYDVYGRLRQAAARHAGVSSDELVTSCGSSELLDAAVSAFTSPQRALVTAAPTFERPARRAGSVRAPVVSLPLDTGGRLDLDGMLAGAAGAGLVYVCNPNNPTATIHGARDIRAFVEGVQARAPEAIVLIDEAYHEYVESPSHATAIPLATASPSVIVIRTFSKLYGMAGLRAGFAVGQPATLARMSPWLSGLSMSIPAAEAAMASLADTGHVAEQRRLNAEARRLTLDAFARAGCTAFASEANFVMVHVGRDCWEFANACAARGVRIARAFPPLSQHARITIGTMDEMTRATAVFDEALRAPAASVSRSRAPWEPGLEIGC